MHVLLSPKIVYQDREWCPKTELVVGHEASGRWCRKTWYIKSPVFALSLLQLNHFSWIVAALKNKYQKRKLIVSPLFQTITTGIVNPGFCNFWACIPESCII